MTNSELPTIQPPPGYTVGPLLGEGTFAWVYRGVSGTGRTVALKYLKNPEGNVLDRFLREARILGRLNHSGLVKVHDSVLAGGHPCLICELVEGEDLDVKLQREGPMPWPDARSLLREILIALEFAHERGVLHRDLKPANVILPTSGGIKLADFGLASWAGTEASLTQGSSLMGSPAYIAPETIQGAETDARTDLYAIGIIAYELLTGKRPFPETGLAALLESHVKEIPIRPGLVRPGIPRAMGAWVMSCLAKDPDQRPASAREARRKLELATPGAVTQARDTPIPDEGEALPPPARSPSPGGSSLARTLPDPGLVQTMDDESSDPPAAHPPRPHRSGRTGRTAPVPGPEPAESPTITMPRPPWWVWLLGGLLICELLVMKGIFSTADEYSTVDRGYRSRKASGEAYPDVVIPEDLPLEEGLDIQLCRMARRVQEKPLHELPSGRRPWQLADRHTILKRWHNRREDIGRPTSWSSRDLNLIMEGIRRGHREALIDLDQLIVSSCADMLEAIRLHREE